MATVLVVDDDRHLLEALCATLELAGISVLGASDGASALELLAARDVGLVISDVGMAPMDGLALLAEVRRRRPEVPVALMTAYGLVEQAVEAMRAGAADYLSKPIEAEALVALANRLLTVPSEAAPSGFIAEDPRTLEVLNLATRVAKSSATVLLTGESGVGKEMFARYVHAMSTRASGPFIAINCAAHSRARSNPRLASSSSRTAVRCCSTRYRRCRSACRQSCCACCRNAKWNA
jgi:two-component system response regulator FlrC